MMKTMGIDSFSIGERLVSKVFPPFSPWYRVKVTDVDLLGIVTVAPDNDPSFDVVDERRTLTGNDFKKWDKVNPCG